MINNKILNKNITIWVIASFLVSFGDLFVSTAIPIVSYDITHSSQMAALVVFMDICPYVIFSPIVGFIVDRFNKKKIIIISNFLSSLTLLLIFLFPTNVALCLIVNFLISMFSVCYTTTAKTMLPSITNDLNTISRINSIISVVLEIACVAGAGIAGLLVALINYKYLFLIAVLIYVLNVVLVFAVKLTSASIEDEDSDINAKNKSWDDFNYKNVIFYLFNNKPFLKITFYYLVLFFIRGILYSQVVVFLINELKKPNYAYSIFENCILIGMLIAEIYMSKYALSKNKIKTCFRCINLLILSLLFFAYSGNICITLFFGIFQAILINSWYTYFYQNIPEKIRGKVLSLSTSLFEITRLLGIAIVFVTCSLISAKYSYIIFSCILLCSIFIINKIMSNS